MNTKIEYLRALVTKRLSEMDERGASAVEYGLLIAGIAVVVIAIVFTLGGHIKSLFTKTDSCLSTSGSGC